VELVRLYSNLALSALALVESRVQARARLRSGDHTTTRQAHHRLRPPEVMELIEAYQQNEPVNQLALRFGIHRVTVTALLRRHGVEMRRAGLRPHDEGKLLLDVATRPQGLSNAASQSLIDLSFSSRLTP
jgi:hypothetical protein